MVGPAAPVERVAARVRELAGEYEPPEFAEVPSANVAFFLTAIDHGTGYRGRYLVDGRGPYEGSALLWALGLRAERRAPGLLSARGLAEIEGEQVDELFRVEGETVGGAADRAHLWREAAAHLDAEYGGEATGLIAAANGTLEGPAGLLERLAEIESYSDPLRKKSFLVCKIWERRGWLRVVDPESWQVSSDNVLMRLALRSGLVRQGEVEEVREATREAFHTIAVRAGISPPLLDDLLWELGRDDPDLLGTDGGELSEPPRRAGVHFY